MTRSQQTPLRIPLVVPPRPPFSTKKSWSFVEIISKMETVLTKVDVNLRMDHMSYERIIKRIASIRLNNVSPSLKPDAAIMEIDATFFIEKII